MDPLNNIVYLSIPEDFVSQIEDFTIDKSVPLPVEIPEGKESVDISELSWEMLVSGMLKILAFDPQNKHVGYYREFIKTIKPGIVPELTTIAIHKAQSGDYDLSEEIFLALLGLEPEDNRILLNMAILFENRAFDTEQSDEELRKEYLKRTSSVYDFLLNEEEIIEDVYLYAGAFLIKNNEITRAKTYLESFLELSDDEKKKSKASGLLRDLMQRSQEDIEFKQAFEAIRDGREEEGIELAEKFLSIHPEVWNGWFLLGWAKRRLKRFKEAITAFEKARSLTDPHTDLLNELAICCLETGHFEESRQCLDEALRLEPENTKVMSNLGILLLKQNQIDEAAKTFQLVLDGDPGDPIAQEYLKLIEKS